MQGQSGLPNQRRPLLALSLGPYGAILPSLAEYTGLYPLPRLRPDHPQETTASELLVVSDSEQTADSDTDTQYTPPSNTFFTTPISRETRHSLEYLAYEASIEALSKWHFTRCLVYASHVDIWSEIDYLAFETVPLIREAKAIRQAVSDLYATTLDDSRKIEPKPWWISFTFPDGELPEASYIGGQSCRPRTSLTHSSKRKNVRVRGKCHLQSQLGSTVPHQNTSLQS